ncbi:hypothetical protein VPH35_050907 [Triticum aestivum]
MPAVLTYLATTASLPSAAAALALPSSCFSKAETGKVLPSPVGVLKVILEGSSFSMYMSQRVIQMRSSLLLTPVMRFILRSSTKAVTSVPYETCRPICLKVCVSAFFWRSQTKPVARL